MANKQDDIPLYHFPKKPDELPFVINKIDSNTSESWDSEPDRHTFIMLFWITNGDGIHHIDFQGYPIRPRCLYLLRAGQTHFFEGATGIEGYIVQFKEELLRLSHNPEMSDFGLDLFYLISRTPVYQLAFPQAGVIDDLFFQLYQEYKGGKFGQLQAIQNLMQLLFIHLRRYHQIQKANEMPLAADLLTAQFQQMVDERFAEMHQLQAYAELLGVTVGHLSTSVKGVLGMPASYILRRRIVIEAKRLLAYTQLTTVQISHTLGFKDTAYFCRYFKRETAHSPLTFRTTYREKYHTHPAKSLQY